MNVLALHSVGHDAAVSWFADGRLRFSIEAERLTRRKHEHRVEIALDHCLTAGGCDPAAVDVVAVSTPVRSALLRVPDLDRAMVRIGAGALHHETTCELLGRRTDCVIVCHEVGHAALAAHYAGYRDATILVNEGRGQVSRSSLFRVRGGQLEWVARDPLPWYGNGFGWSGLAYLLGFGTAPGAAGKLMALGAYGEASERVRELLLGVDPRIADDRELAETEGRALVRRAAPADLVRALQDLFTDAVVAVGADAVGGGCALNIVANTALAERLGAAPAIPPACGDCGQSLGAGVYVSGFVRGERVGPFSVYSNGAEPDPPAWATYDPEAVADALARGAVVAWLDGRAELGPRALGHRSLLASPTTAGMRRRLSEEIKGREWFRPLGAVMRAERFAELLPGQPASPHMLFAHRPPPDAMPEALHADGTSRIQTLERRGHPRLHDLLTAFEERTGTPALLNTSLNRAGRAIAHTAADALDDLRGTDVDLIVAGDAMLPLGARVAV